MRVKRSEYIFPSHYSTRKIILISYMLTHVPNTEPGGYLQWDESDISSVRIEKAQPGNKTEAVTRLFDITQKVDSRLKPTWVPSWQN